MAGLGSSSTSFSVPQHPLPEEIQKMQRDETVCKFCGVSYLIHNEVKALQEKLAEAERQMEYYKGSIEREKVLKEKIEKEEVKMVEQTQMLKEQAQQLELFKSDLKMKADLINGMHSQKRQTEKKLQEAQRTAEELKSQLSQLCVVLPRLKSVVRQQKESLKILKNQASTQQVSFKNNVNCMKSDLERVLGKVIRKVESEKRSTEMRWKEVNEQLWKCQTELNTLRAARNQVNDLRAKSGDLENKLSVYEKHVKYMEQENKTLREKTSAVENELCAKSSEVRKCGLELESLRKEKQEEQLKQQEEITKKGQEINKLNELCKSLEKLMNEKSAAEMEVRQKASSKDIQLKTLEESLSQARAESGKLKLEREQTIISHHNRIEQLRESYARQLGEANESYEQLQREFNEQQKKLEGDSEESKNALRDQFGKEIEGAKQEHAEQLRIIRSQNEILNEKLTEETRISQNYRKEINQLKNALSTNKAKTVQELQSYQNEVLGLKAKLNEMQQEVKNRDEGESSEEMAALKRKHQNAQKSLQDVKTQLKLLEQQLTNNKNEMTILQDTVRRECEERLELTQALSDARIQLLSLQQNSGAPRETKITSRNHPIINGGKRLVNRPTVCTKISDLNTTTNSEVITSDRRRVKSTGSDSSKPSRESVDSFRERIAAALGRQSRTSHTR